MQTLHDRGVHQVLLNLDPYTAGEQFWQSLFAEMSSRNVRIGLYIECFTLPSDEFVRAYASIVDREHSQLCLSPLSGDEKVRALNGKDFGNHNLLLRVKTMRKLRIPLAVYYSFNLPGQTEETLRRTIFLTNAIGRAYPPQLLTVYNQPHTVDPYSPMSREPERYGIKVTYQTFDDYVQYCRRTAVEKPGVMGINDRGFAASVRSPQVEKRMQALWLDFARRQRYLCF